MTKHHRRNVKPVFSISNDDHDCERLIMVFTGLIQVIGKIVHIQPTTEYEGYAFTISNAESILGDCSIGDSIAVSGVCLTVTAFDAAAGTFVVGLSNETLARTNLGNACPFLACHPMSKNGGRKSWDRGA